MDTSNRQRRQKTWQSISDAARRVIDTWDRQLAEAIGIDEPAERNETTERARDKIVRRKARRSGNQ